MKTGTVICIALVVLSLVVMILSVAMGTHESAFYLPNGDSLTIEETGLKDAFLNGEPIEPQVTDDYNIVFWSSYASAIIFMLALIPIELFGRKTKEN